MEQSEILKDFLYIPYDEVEEKNLTQIDREKRDNEKLEHEHRKYLTEEKRIKAVTLCFSDIEGRFHMLFYSPKDENNFSKFDYDFIDRILASAADISLILNSSVNPHRRLDPAFEAPNQIKCSAIDRTSMIRIPFGNKGSTRIEVLK